MENRAIRFFSAFFCWILPAVTPVFAEESPLPGVAPGIDGPRLFALGALAALGFYHFVLFLHRRNWWANLWFALFAWAMATRSLPVGNGFMEAAASLWLFTAPPLLLIFLRELFRREFPRLPFHGIFAPAVVSLVAVLLMADARPTIIKLHGLLLGAGMIAVTVVLILATVNRRAGAWVLLLGWAVFVTTEITELAMDGPTRGVNGTSRIAGVLGLIFSQAYYLSMQFNRALRVARDLTDQLDHRVRERTAKLNEALETIHEDLQLARQVQEVAARETDPMPPELIVARHSLPMAEVGGDLYSIQRITPHRVRIFLADAIGHGIHAALVTMVIKAEFEIHNDPRLSPSQVLRALNYAFHNKHIALTPYFSCVLVDIDLDRYTLRHSSAGHPEQLLITGGNKIQSLKRQGPVIGLVPEREFGEEYVDFAPGHRLLLFTDGIIEQFNAGRELFGHERLIQVLSDQPPDRDLHWTIASLLGRLHAFVGNAGVVDDITLLGFEFAHPGETRRES